MENKKWDAIVIGSGVGGLAIAGLLARKKNKRVLVVERASKVGGFTHEFSRRSRYIFDVGVHYIGGAVEGGPFRQLCDFLTDGRLKWNKLPDAFEYFYFPDFKVTLHSGGNLFKERLVARYPSEKANLNKYFEDLQKYSHAYYLWLFLECVPLGFRQLLRCYLRFRYRKMFLSTKSYLQSRFSSRELIGILCGQWGAHGILPELCLFGYHAVQTTASLNGNWYPANGGQAIPEELKSAILAFEGEVRTDTEVVEILTEGNAAIGVQIRDKKGAVKTEFSNTIISNSGIQNTYQKLIKNPPLSFKNLQGPKCRPSAISIYIGMKGSPERYGFTQSNYWIFSDGNFRYPVLGENGEIEINTIDLCFPSLKRTDSLPTAEIIFPIDASTFSEWSETRWKKRPETYELFKQRLYRAAIDLVQTQFPDFEQHVLFSEVGTPLSVRHFQGHPLGLINGAPAAIGEDYQGANKVQSPIKNLFLVGSDVFCYGIGGATASAIKLFHILECRKSLRERVKNLIEIRRSIERMARVE